MSNCINYSTSHARTIPKKIIFYYLEANFLEQEDHIKRPIEYLENS